MFAGFASPEGALFVQMIIEAKPRYVRDQLGILLKLTDLYSSDKLQRAVMNPSKNYIYNFKTKK